MKKRKKSLVGWTEKDWNLTTEYIKAWFHLTLKKKVRGEAVKVRITIEEI